MDKLYIVIPAYNEEENINSVIENWYPIVERIGNGSKLVIIDDGSKDSTYTLMKKAAETRAAFEPITKSNGGHGATVLYGYHHAIHYVVRLVVLAMTSPRKDGDDERPNSCNSQEARDTP